MRALILVVLASLLAASPAAAMVELPDPIPAVAKNPANALAGEAIEAFRYDPATRCTKRRRPGMDALIEWLDAHALGVSWGTYRCEKWGKKSASLHSEGRALDWHLDVRKAAERREAERLILLLLAPDKAGEPQALARRMGVQEIIWDCGYMSIGNTSFSRLSVCSTKSGKRRKRVDPTQAHRDHVHFGLTKKGAAGRTTFWG